jgi:hypothetical protein
MNKLMWSFVIAFVVLLPSAFVGLLFLYMGLRDLGLVLLWPNMFVLHFFPGVHMGVGDDAVINALGWSPLLGLLIARLWAKFGNKRK